jgi:hypothetical protein
MGRSLGWKLGMEPKFPGRGMGIPDFANAFPGTTSPEISKTKARKKAGAKIRASTQVGRRLLEEMVVCTGESYQIVAKM